MTESNDPQNVNAVADAFGFVFRMLDDENFTKVREAVKDAQNKGAFPFDVSFSAPEAASKTEDGTEVTEEYRIYEYVGHRILIDKPRRVKISDSGNHRIQTEDGQLHIIAPGWIAIHIDDNGKGWTF